MYQGFIYINKMKAIRIIILIVLIASVVVIHPNCELGVLLNCYRKNGIKDVPNQMYIQKSKNSSKEQLKLLIKLMH